MRRAVRIMSAVLDEAATSRGQQIVLRGVVDPVHLQLLKIDDYQREALPLSALTKMWQALRDGESLPDIELGLRSSDYENDGSEFWLEDKLYIIDGQQRRNAALHILSIMPDLNVRIGAMIHFGTTREWERERFRVLNLERAKVSPNVLLRNMRYQSKAVLTLYGLCHNEPNFALFERVCWRQAMAQKELVSARTLCSVAGSLHAHKSLAFRNTLAELVPALDRQAGLVKLDRWRQNIVYFFDLIDECFGVRKITLRDLAPQIKTAFLTQTAIVLSDHTNFWRGDLETELYVSADWRKRFATFPIHDPSVVQMIGYGASGVYSTRGSQRENLLYSLIRDHLNKGRSTGRLVNREELLESKRPRRFASVQAANADDENDVRLDEEVDE